MKTKILIPIAESDESQHILNHIPNFFSPDKAELVLLQVTEEPDMSSVTGISETDVPEVAVGKLPPPVTNLSNQLRPTVPPEEDKPGLKEGQDAAIDPIAYKDQAIEERRHEVEDTLEKIAVPLRKDGYKVATDVRFGEPTEEILSHAEVDESIDLIAMTTHNRSGLKHFLKGSVAEEIVQNTHTPVLLVRREEE